ncbi:Ras GTPase-activating protein, putative [Entamoeba histolytica HM-1:IMSS-B]|uniref:Ras GTPase-activating protein, putative n=6 Tax=Entamoeba histolytica TaxID=5759 RepID=C4M3M8_ENTH1|nr:Ras GTPase-activating protein, putative [Entamoeba histolytica HM-1:IMSS]EMD46050.1 Ras GTPase-activating protein, putative [Entamoeba histolytica KU27]EMH78308.1 Ras GTPase-activating protein, putative [Entamoeba histolytica HM-1:IMSS-B]EMS16733.1 Ras GTPase-activating protein, putative [Entamoeba histolytica HM-3:IMSS]ENY64987.1 Ras GTPase-activating protein, putative [Entamoeba histolytica HM-1:IMSS-A]GAT95930.1 Ras GTPase-activating protein putative [Entamoeba histolytica]|eukprot:XP_654188.1 Ras GTPase-activating protein, putative [Entamoeba histolytica HM-1:IMSS]
MTEVPCISELFFQHEPTPLLLTYCKIMIKGCDLVESRVHCKLLIRYATGYGLLREVLSSLGKLEIQNTPPSSFIFRGNSAFTRLFFYYIESSSTKYLNKVISTLVDEMMTNPRFYFDSVDPTQAENENLVFESLDSVTEIMDELGKLIISNLDLIPPQVFGIIKELLNEVQKKDPENTEQVIITFKTIFFLRFLFPALNSAEKYVSIQLRLELSQIIDQVRSIVKFGQLVVNGKHSPDELTKYVLQACGGFSKTVDSLFKTVIKYNEIKSKECLGIDYNTQLSVTKELLSYIKPFLKDFQTELESNGHADIFNRIFYCSKNTKHDCLEVTPLLLTTKKMHHFMMSRLSQLQHENEFYLKKIVEMKRINKRLKSTLESSCPSSPLQTTPSLPNPDNRRSVDIPSTKSILLFQ